MTEIRRILQLEDDSLAAGVVGIVAKMHGVEVELTETIAQAKDALDGRGYSGLFNYKLLLLDMSLPDGRGAEIASLARQKGYEGRIVMFSGDLVSAKKATEHLDKIGYLEKPCDIKYLMDIIENI